MKSGKKTIKRIISLAMVIITLFAFSPLSYIMGNDALDLNTVAEAASYPSAHLQFSGSASVGQPNAHVFTNYISNGNVTCAADGTQTAKCDNCNATDTNPLTELEHDYVETEIDSHHTENGIYAEICSRCHSVKPVITEKTTTSTQTFTNSYPESAHDYSDNYAYTWTYNAPVTAENISIEFNSRTATESDYDFIYIYTLNGTEIGAYSGTSLAGETVSVPGSGFKIMLTSDISNTDYGFKIDSITGTVSVINTYDETHYHLDNTEYTSRVKTAATCTSNGITEYTCSVCGLKYEESNIPAFGHTEVIDKAVASTCSKTGLTQGSHCSVCKAVIIKQNTVAKKKHTNKTAITKATLTKSGSTVTKCTVCGKVSDTDKIYYPKTISLSATSYTYDGKVKTPSVTVKDSNGGTLKKDKDYSVKLSSGRKNVGEYTVTVTFKGSYYSGSKKLSFKIVPKGTSISSVSAASCAFTANWKKQSSQTTGYQLQYSTSSGFSSAKTVTVKKNTTVSQTVSKLKASTKYYVRIRTYKTVDGENYYSDWSAKKSVTTKPAVGITLKSSSATLYTGGTKTISYSTYPTKVTVTWKSSDTSVAKVSSKGKVTAVKKGTATITASFKNGGKTYKDTCKITVKTPSIKLNKTSATVTVKSSITLSANVTPSSASVKWKSSNTSVAKVSSSGKVTGVKAGTATITASFSYGGKTYKATCKVTVKKVTDKDRYNKVVNYIKKNGNIKYVFNDGEIQYATIIGESNGALNFYIIETINNYIYDDSFVRYKYGDTYAKETGTVEMYDEEIMRFETNIPVKDFDQYYNLRYSIDYLAMYEEAVDSSLEVHNTLVNIGFIYWNAQLEDLFGFGMRGIGFSSFE